MGNITVTEMCGFVLLTQKDVNGLSIYGITLSFFLSVAITFSVFLATSIIYYK